MPIRFTQNAGHKVRANRQRVLVAVLALLAGCWPFEPRPAEPPLNVVAPPPAWAPEETPGVLQSIYNHPLPAQDLNSVLASRFRFHSDPAEITGSREWDRETEIQVTEAIMSHFPAMVLQFEPSQTPDPIAPQGPVWISRLYRLSVADSQGIIGKFAGQAEFLVAEKSTQEWEILDWYDYDIKTDSVPTLGQLKIQHRY